jgi:ADP-heptose:LPS heptosyltransferase
MPKKIIISPWSRSLRNKKENPKNYPWWEELVKLLKEEDEEYHIIQIGLTGEVELQGVDELFFNKSLKDLIYLLNECETWISVDNFFQHLAYVHSKPGFVLFGKSNPDIFGHKENVNILKDRKYLRTLQFDIWERIDHSNDCFVEPEIIMERISKGA